MILPIVFWSLIAICIGLYGLLLYGVITAPITDIIKEAERKYGKWSL